jgi:hypothetical protein
LVDYSQSKAKKRLFHGRNIGSNNKTLVSRSGMGPFGCQGIGLCINITNKVSEPVITERFSGITVIILTHTIGIRLKSEIVSEGRIV